MIILPRYVLRAHIAPFIFGTSVVMFLFLLQFVLKYIDKLIGKGLGTWVIIQLIGLNLAWMVVLAVPMGVLFSTLMSFGGMSAAHEVTIMKASGSGLIRQMIPSIIMGAVLSVGLFWFNDQVLPDANHRAKVLMLDIERKKPTFSVDVGQFTTQLDGLTILSRNVDSVSGALYGVTIYDKKNPQRTNVVSADTGFIRFTPDYNNVVIMLHQGEIHQVFPQTLREYRKITFAKHQIVLPASGFLLQQSGEGMFSRGDREMKIADMQKIVDEARAMQYTARAKSDSLIAMHYQYLTGKSTGLESTTLLYDSASARNRALAQVSTIRSQIEGNTFQDSDAEKRARQYLVEIYKKYAIPLACFVFVFVGAPLGVITRGGSFGASAAISLGFYIVYWACLIGGEKLADRKIASPLAMFLADVVVGALGIILTIRTNNESFGIVDFFKRLFVKPQQPTRTTTT